MDEIIACLQEQQVSPALLQDIENFRNKYPVAQEAKARVTQPQLPFLGKETFEMAASALLQGENILLTGAKAAGKNILADKSCLAVWTPALQYFFSCEYGQQYADRNRYVPG